MSPVDFQQDVIERSRRVPVVVDFWAAWCGPCRILGPIVEKLAAEAGSRWELVKVDTEQQPELAQAYDVRGIPAVKLFRDGEVAAEFTGALPESQIRQWLDDNLPDPRHDRLADLARTWETRGAETVADLERFVADHPDLAEARLRLALALVATDPARARVLAAEARGDADTIELADDVAALADLAELDAGRAPEKVGKPLEAARQAFLGHDLDATLARLVDAAMIDKRYGDELARRAAVALFRVLGHEHALTREHRSRLSMALHS